MPRLTDTDLNRSADQFIVMTQIVECPECDTTFDGTFPTEARDEDGLTDLEAGEFGAGQTCPNCSHEWFEVFTGWTNYGDA